MPLSAPFRARCISIHATLAGGDGKDAPVPPVLAVSIHATLAGGDNDKRWERFQRHCNFYPRHPRGWRLPININAANQRVFLSTPPSRVATTGAGYRHPTNQISIHATLAGGDRSSCSSRGQLFGFLSTPPSRVATPCADALAPLLGISIHATLAGGDRSSCSSRGQLFGFLSTPPSRVATPCADALAPLLGISIHATLAGGDLRRISQTFPRGDFYPRHPRGWRPPSGSRYSQRGYFYPRHPRGWRRLASSMPTSILLFLSTPPSRVATLFVLY